MHLRPVQLVEFEIELLDIYPYASIQRPSGSMFFPITSRGKRTYMLMRLVVLRQLFRDLERGRARKSDRCRA